jgi:tetratricopeptide (TPR) repeat protein
MARRLEPALLTLERLLKAEPANTNALKLYGDVLYLLGRESEAEKALESALTIDPRHDPSRYSLGRIRYQQSRFDEAADLFRTLLQQDPEDYRSHDNLALCYAALRQDALAIRHFLRALEIVHEKYPKYDTVYANAANFFLERDQYEKAFQLAAEAAKRNPVSARNFFLTGKALVKLEKQELSVRWFKQAAELEPTYTEPHYWLAQVYRKLERTEEANSELQKFRELTKAPRARR